MPVPVIAFPPVGVVGTMWTVAAPVARSTSLFTGKRYVSRFGPERRLASIRLSALAKGRSGAGFSEMLTRYLDGGANLVRLNSYPINWHLDQQRLAGLRSSERLEWTMDGEPLDWESGGDPLLWFNGRVLSGVVSGDQVTVSGLPPSMLIARPGDFLEALDTLAATSGTKAQIVTEAYSNASGVAVIKLFDAITAGSYPLVNIGVSESRVFEVDGAMPRSPQSLGSNWFYEWNFREVLPNEVDGFDEVDPWN